MFLAGLQEAGAVAQQLVGALLVLVVKVVVVLAQILAPQRMEQRILVGAVVVAVSPVLAPVIMEEMGVLE